MFLTSDVHVCVVALGKLHHDVTNNAAAGGSNILASGAVYSGDFIVPLSADHYTTTNCTSSTIKSHYFI